MKTLLNDLSTLPDTAVPFSVTQALYRYDESNEERDALFAALLNDASALDNNQHLYNAVLNYLGAKLFDHMPLSDDEVTLVPYFPELDEERIIRVQVTNELIDKAVEQPDSLTDDEQHALRIVLVDRVIDGEEMNSHMLKAFNATSSEPQLLDQKNDWNKLVKLEYGYDIFDLETVKQHLIMVHEKRIPISQRERNIISKKHGINPDIGF